MKDASAMLKSLARKQTAPQPKRWPVWFILSAGGILALAGADNVLNFFGKSQMWDLQDPLLGIPFHYLLPLVGLVELFVAWLCLFTDKRTLALGLVAWLVVNFVVYRIGLWTMGWHHPWVLVAGLIDILNISPLLADAVQFQTILYLLAGSVFLLLRPQTEKMTAPLAPVYFKVHCLSCGGKTAFDSQWLGQTIPCPHCGSPLLLNKPIA